MHWYYCIIIIIQVMFTTATQKPNSKCNSKSRRVEVLCQRALLVADPGYHNALESSSSLPRHAQVESKPRIFEIREKNNAPQAIRT